KGTPVKKLIAVEGRRWTIEDSFESAKNELGLDHNESRSWHGWHRHVSLVMLAFAMMAAIRHHTNAAPFKKGMARPVCKGFVRGDLISLHQRIRPVGSPAAKMEIRASQSS